MLAKEKATLDEQVEPLITTMTWEKYDRAYIEETFELIKDYYDRVMKAQDNVRKIVASINSWGDVPLYMRKDNNTDTLLDIANREATISTRLRKCLLSKRMIEKVILDENYRLYFNIPPSCPCSSGSEDSEEEEADEAESRRRSRTASQRQQTISESLGDVNRLREMFSTTIVIESAHLELYRPYQEYVDNLVSNAMMSAVHIR